MESPVLETVFEFSCCIVLYRIVAEYWILGFKYLLAFQTDLFPQIDSCLTTQDSHVL